MIKVQDTPRKGIVFGHPKNLQPVVFICKVCGCTIGYNISSSSYYLVQLSPEVKAGLKNLCSFCMTIPDSSLKGKIQ